MRTILCLLIMYSIQTQACQSNLDCEIGYKCLKASDQLYGFCSNGNANDMQPVQSSLNPQSKQGQTCTNQFECDIGQKCLKQGYAFRGVCI